MANKFYKKGEVWIAQRDGDRRIKYPPRGWYILSIDGENISVVRDIIKANPLFLDTPVTTIEKNDSGDTYSSIEEFIAYTYPFFTDDPKESFKDISERTATNSVFGDRIVGTRHSSIAAQFQYGVRNSQVDMEQINGGTIDIVNSMLHASSSSDPNGRARVQSVKTVRYIPGQEIYALFTAVFTPPVPNSYQRIGLFEDLDGFYIGYEGEVFTFTRRKDGINYPMTIDLEAFNSKHGYILDPTKGNVYRISYGYLGFAPISLEVLLPSGAIHALAKIEYPNSHTSTHTDQTYLPVRGEVGNAGNTTNIEIYSGSVAAGIVNGKTDVLDPTSRSYSWFNSTVFTVGAPNSLLVCFRNKIEYKNKVNYVAGRLLLLSGANEVNKNCRWRLIANPTFLNTPTWNEISSGESIIEYSEDGIIDFSTSQDLLLSWNTGKLDSFFEMVGELEIDMMPGGVAAFIIDTAGTGEADLSIRWKELF